MGVMFLASPFLSVCNHQSFSLLFPSVKWVTDTMLHTPLDLFLELVMWGNSDVWASQELYKRKLYH